MKTSVLISHPILTTPSWLLNFSAVSAALLKLRVWELPSCVHLRHTSYIRVSLWTKHHSALPRDFPNVSHEVWERIWTILQKSCVIHEPYVAGFDREVVELCCSQIALSAHYLTADSIVNVSSITIHSNCRYRSWYHNMYITSVHCPTDMFHWA